MRLPRPLHLVTGTTSGVGRETARRLAARGGSVILHARTRDKGAPVVDQLRRETGNQALALVAADFEALDQVRAMALEVAEMAPDLDVLVNNAGVVRSRKAVTADGFELTLQVNHLAPFLLTLLLLEPLRRAGGRVVTVSSGAHGGGAGLEADTVEATLRGEGRYRGMESYAASKLANILFTRELARREADRGVTAFSVHPGVLSTGIWKGQEGLLYRAIHLLTPLLGDPDRGAAAVCDLVAAPDGTHPSGAYFDKGSRAEPRLPPDPEGTARALWDASLAAVGLD